MVNPFPHPLLMNLFTSSSDCRFNPWAFNRFFKFSNTCVGRALITSGDFPSIGTKSRLPVLAILYAPVSGRTHSTFVEPSNLFDCTHVNEIPPSEISLNVYDVAAPLDSYHFSSRFLYLWYQTWKFFCKKVHQRNQLLLHHIH